MQLETTGDYDIEYGTPQGSCLGPFIFLIFCNDLSLHLEHLGCIQFADDTTLYLGHKHPHFLRYCIETDLSNIQDWFNANKLTLNIGKTVYILFDKKEKINDLGLVLNEMTIPRVEYTKFLGLWIDDTGWERLIRSHLSARFCFELTGNLN